MTPIQIICVYVIGFTFAALMIALFGTLAYIDKGEFKKAISTAIFCVILAIIIFAVILVVF